MDLCLLNFGSTTEREKKRNIVFSLLLVIKSAWLMEGVPIMYILYLIPTAKCNWSLKHNFQLVSGRVVNFGVILCTRICLAITDRGHVQRC